MTINLDYAKAERQASTLEQCAGEMLQQSKAVGTIISEVRHAWQGDTANAYLRKLEALRDELRLNSERCNEDAIDFRARIRAIKKADEDAQRAIGD